MWLNKISNRRKQNPHAEVIAAYVEEHLREKSFDGVKVTARAPSLNITFTQDDHEKGLQAAIRCLEELHNQGRKDKLFDHVAQDPMHQSVGGFGRSKRYEVDITCHKLNEQGVELLRERDKHGILSAMTSVANRDVSLV